MDIDINLVAHAKDYIEDLAKGVNPLTKETVDENDVINNVKISRCLFYVSDILKEIVANGGINPKITKKPKQKLFDPQQLDLSQFIFHNEPITVSIITQKINDLKPEDMKKLKVTAITNWLVDINMLTVVKINGKNHKQPTANAESIGITMQEREGPNGTYYYVLYNEAAQHFIIDNLASIIDGGYNDKKKQ